MIGADAMLVLVVVLLAVALHPGAREQLARAELAFRMYRNGYTWRAAWRLAAR